jgi:hypothetical protein
MKTIADPCCGSGGFLLAAQSYLADPQHYTLDREEKEFLKKDAFRGWEIVPTTFKMSLMNLYLPQHRRSVRQGSPSHWEMHSSPTRRAVRLCPDQPALRQEIGTHLHQ